MRVRQKLLRLRIGRLAFTSRVTDRLPRFFRRFSLIPRLAAHDPASISRASPLLLLLIKVLGMLRHCFRSGDGRLSSPLHVKRAPPPPGPGSHFLRGAF